MGRTSPKFTAFTPLIAGAYQVTVVRGFVMAVDGPVVNHVAAAVGHHAADGGVEAVLGVLHEHLLARGQGA